MSILEELARRIATLSEKVALAPTLQWATVTNTSPLQICLDGSDAHLAGIDCIGSPQRGQRVLAILWNRRVTIISGNAGANTSGGGVPTGTIVPFAGNTAPNGWLLCDGTQYSSSSYPTLYAIIGTTYGGGNGSFKVPDLRGRMPVGKNYGTFTTLGSIGGEETHVLTNAEMAPDVYMDVSGSKSTELVNIGGGNRWANTGRVNGAQAGRAHNNMPPYLVLNYIIKT